jgi:ABC-type multidrug transport system ATPase subunit
MILTTHLMEEAEVLSDRIGIIVQGHLKCLGTQFKLKRVYGRGFKLIINLVASKCHEEEISEEKIVSVEKFIKELFKSSTITEKYKSTVIFHVNLNIKLDSK